MVLLLIGGIVGLVLVQQRSDLTTKASPELTPKQTSITNLSDTSFTVTWITDASTAGFLEYGTTSNPENVASDDRDVVTGEIGSFNVHHVTVRDLQPQTTYYFKINSGGSSFDNNGKPYEVITGPVLTPPDESEVAYGLVHTSAGTPAEGSLVIMEISGVSTLSTLVKASGSWAIPLSMARTDDGSQYGINSTQTYPITLKIISPEGTSTTGVTTTDNDQPVPTITLGQSFDYSQPTDTAEDDSSEDMNLASSEASNSAEVELLNPSFEGERINTTLPEFQGKAPANTTLQIKVESPETFTGQVVTDESGSFAWSPPGDLEPGEHTITITYTDLDGILRQFTRSFFVYAQGESNLPSLTATPSGSTPTPTPIATPIPTSTPTPTTTPRPTVTPSPTTAATQSGRTSLPATGSGIPVAGSTTATVAMMIFGASLIGAGVLLSRSLHLMHK